MFFFLYESISLVSDSLIIQLFFMCFIYNSIKNTDENNPSCEDGSPMEVPAEFDSDVTVVYTYSVKFEVSL